MRRGFVLGTLGLAVLACSSGGNSGGGGSGGAAGFGGAAGNGGGAPACEIHTTAGIPTFTKRTDDWGLATITGNRLVAVDLDGDDYPDLVVHSVGSNADGRDPLDGGVPKKLHVLMNRPGPNGGRTFVDETVASGYGATRDGGAGLRSAQLAVAADIDNDGDLDLFSGSYTDNSKVQSPPTPADTDRSEIMLNDGSGKFSFGPKLEPHASLGMPTSGATFADVDRDGKIDLFVVGWYESYGTSYVGTQARLHLGQGDGSFAENTANAGLLTDTFGFDEGTSHRPAYGTTSCDVDGDGDMDLLVSAYGRQLNQLYLNDGTGNFVDAGQPSGFAGDDNVDFSDNQMFLCWCTTSGAPECPPNPQPIISCQNTGWSAFDEKPWRNNGNTFATVCSDITGDGVMDLYNAEIHHFWAGGSSDSSQLLVGDTSGGQIHFNRPGNDATGMVWPHPTAGWNEGGLMATAADLDNDGREDVIVAASDYPDQYSLVFHQKDDGKYEEVGEAWGLHHPCTSGLAVADFDRDGDLDVVVGSGTARDCGKIWSDNFVHFYENDASTKGKWLSVHLKGKAGVNAAAIGARVTVGAGEEQIMKEVGGGYGHFGMQNDLVLFFGVGACEQVDVSVRWPDGALTTEARGIESTNQLVTIEGPGQ